jgi:hypothetical protein
VNFRPGLVALGRFGLAVKGVIQLLVGLLALAAVFGDRHGRITDAPGALGALAAEPTARPLLLVLCLGLLAYAGLQVVQGLFDPLHRPRTPGTWLGRAGELVGGATHALLALGAGRLFMGLGANLSSDARSRRLTAETLALPYGPKMLVVAAVLLGALSLLFAARALIVRDVCANLMKDQMPPALCRAAAVMIRVASALQALLFGTMATLVYRAAQLHDARAVRGMGGVVRLIGSQQGTVILAVLALGFVIMSGTSFIEARWRKLA